ncbi:MAG: hypothetical protein E6R13_09165 [Spirochaetes bacterium]|nr:MAG: hypothetical protein E6R13_09165 [Spirochaetota bacterium]
MDKIPLNTLTTKNPGLIEVMHNGHYLRGVPSSLVMKYGNPHSELIGLRKVIYSKFGLSEVEEEWPMWKDRQIIWHREKVSASLEYENLFKMKPMELVRSIYGIIRYDPKKMNMSSLNNHLFAQKILVCELYAIYHDMCLLDVLKLI